VPHIVVTADRADDREEAAVMLRERVSVNDFESAHFASQLVERLGWAVGDADEAERAAEGAERPPPDDDARELPPAARETVERETAEREPAIAR
jgi:hypothetical protein